MNYAERGILVILRQRELKSSIIIAARAMSQDILISADDMQCIFKVRDGTITEIVLDPSPRSHGTFSLKRQKNHGNSFCSPSPHHSFIVCSVPPYGQTFSLEEISKLCLPTTGQHNEC
jgi:hypothetical protein